MNLVAIDVAGVLDRAPVGVIEARIGGRLGLRHEHRGEAEQIVRMPVENRGEQVRDRGEQRAEGHVIDGQLIATDTEGGGRTVHLQVVCAAEERGAEPQGEVVVEWVSALAGSDDATGRIVDRSDRGQQALARRRHPDRDARQAAEERYGKLVIIEVGVSRQIGASGEAIAGARVFGHGRRSCHGVVGLGGVEGVGGPGPI